MNSDSMIQMQRELVIKKRSFEQQQVQLLGEFRNFAASKFKEQGEKIKIDYSLMNGSEKVKYADLNMNQDYTLQINTFFYDQKSDMIVDHLKKVCSGKKEDEDFSKNLQRPGSGMKIQQIESKSLSKASDLDKEKVASRMKILVDSLLMKIFTGQVTYEDAEFKRLVTKNIALQQELNRIDIRLSALNIVTTIEPETPSKTR